MKQVEKEISSGEKEYQEEEERGGGVKGHD